MRFLYPESACFWCANVREIIPYHDKMPQVFVPAAFFFVIFLFENLSRSGWCLHDK